MQQYLYADKHPWKQNIYYILSHLNPIRCLGRWSDHMGLMLAASAMRVRHQSLSSVMSTNWKFYILSTHSCYYPLFIYLPRLPISQSTPWTRVYKLDHKSTLYPNVSTLFQLPRTIRGKVDQKTRSKLNYRSKDFSYRSALHSRPEVANRCAEIGCTCQV